MAFGVGDWPRASGVAFGVGDRTRASGEAALNRGVARLAPPRDNMTNMGEDLLTHKGGCHCGAVQFEVEAPSALRALDCNCSICRKSGYLHLHVPAARFRLLRGEEALSVYTFNTGAAKHGFCKTCGIKSFYIPRSLPDGYSVNIRCLERTNIARVKVEPFDGQNWETAYAAAKERLTG